MTVLLRPCDFCKTVIYNSSSLIFDKHAGSIIIGLKIRESFRDASKINLDNSNEDLL